MGWEREVGRLREQQEGVVRRRQLVDLGLAPHDLERLLRRRLLVPVHPGVYVDHTGPLTRRQREWAAVLAHWPAALTTVSALPGADDDLIHVAIDARRTVHPVDGVRAHRTADVDARAEWNRHPPRIAVEHALVDVASERLARGEITRAFAVLADVCGSRRTTPDRVRAVLAGRRRVAGRRLLEELLVDLEQGTCSVLERGYLHLVERPHGLPRGRRQRRIRTGSGHRYSDVEYPELGVVVEIDGRAFHEGVRAGDRDAQRDLDTLVERAAITPRVTWGMVFDRGCATGRRIGRLLEQRGWSGQVTPCPRCAGAAVRSSA